jgi:hypothetical protein
MASACSQSNSTPPCLPHFRDIVFHLGRWGGGWASEHGIGAAIVAILLFLDSAPDKHGFVLLLSLLSVV